MQHILKSDVSFVTQIWVKQKKHEYFAVGGVNLATHAVYSAWSYSEIMCGLRDLALAISVVQVMPNTF